MIAEDPFFPDNYAIHRVLSPSSILSIPLAPLPLWNKECEVAHLSHQASTQNLAATVSQVYLRFFLNLHEEHDCGIVDSRGERNTWYDSLSGGLTASSSGQCQAQVYS